MMPRQYETFSKLIKAKLFYEVAENRKLNYYDCNHNLQFTYDPNKKHYYKDGNKMYNNEFKRFIRDYAKRINELEAFW
jgi:hypothetical protein